MDSPNSDCNDLINDKDFLMTQMRRNSNRLAFVTKSGKSEVWNRFVRVYYNDIETDYVKCLYCGELQKQTQYSGTSGCLKHRCRQMIEDNPYERLRTASFKSDEVITQMNETVSEAEHELENIDFYVSAIQSCDPLISLRTHKGKSSVWNRYERIFYNNCETKFVKCKHCDDIQRHANGYGTGTLLKHRCGVFADEPFIDEDLENSIESNPLNDKIMIKEMIKNNDQRITFVRENKKSEVWNRFERIFMDDIRTPFVKCKHCECVQKQTRSGGTGGLRKHRCPAFVDKDISFAEENCDSMSDHTNEEISFSDNQSEYLKHLIEENNTLKKIVEKCLNIIDDCLCVNKYNSQQRKEVNVLVNKYNKYLYKTKTLTEMFENQENCETSHTNLDSNKLLKFDSNHRKSVPKSKISFDLIRKKYKKRQQMTNSIKNKYKMRFGCDWPQCHKRFRLEKHLVEHTDIVHLNIKNHECQWPGCEETFLRKSQLNVHILKYHSKARFSCDQCSYKTTYRALLVRHQRIHGTEKVLGCDWPGCDFRTNHEQVLKAHKRTHSGERPFKCSWPSCEWSFRARHHLKAHILKHTGEKPFTCQSTTCDRRFASRQAMKFHFEKVHK